MHGVTMKNFDPKVYVLG